ncbi:serine/threonine-protein kinase pef1-like [Salvelinus namaycush]|uniref:Serine/threonine-protein kinase pef1-like n=1 Tax=Salvelinus namaycush TaxID=8040 RepID=A0A8U0PCV5_SALNM|nr:serine/threonine-protein kinase pef1-like [Salvelinus namaycush]
MENYKRGPVLGNGAYGTVYKVTCLTTGKEYALKYHTRGVEDTTVRELSCLAALRGHPYVIHMHDCFVDNDTIAMLMAYVPYTLGDAIHNGYGVKSYYEEDRDQECLPFSFVAHFSAQVANALSYMHRLNIVHRDLTPYNVLLTEDLTVKVADMGLSRQSSNWMSPNVVTEAYRAPELFLERRRCIEYTCAIDMWSLGVLIVDAMEGKVKFASGNVRRVTMSTYEIITRTLCPKDHPGASSTRCDPDIIMPKVMQYELVKRIVFRLLKFRAPERLLAHELLQDTEWMRAADMTREDQVIVRDQIQRTKSSHTSEVLR